MDMDCNRAREYMDGHLDCELDPVTAAGIETHLKACAACAQESAAHAALRSALKVRAAYYTAPAHLVSRIRNAIPAASGKSTKVGVPLRRWFPMFAAIAATAVVTWSAAMLLEFEAQGDRIGEQVIAGRARSVLTNHATDVASSDQHTVKPWLSSKLDFSPPVTDLTAADFPLVGGRLDYVENRPVAVLVYRHRQHLIDVFVWPDMKRTAVSMQASSKQGFNIVHWTDGGMTFWAVSDVNRADLKIFAEAFTSGR